MTFRLTVQSEVPTVPPVKPMILLPGSALTFAEPQFVMVTFGVEATVICPGAVGKLSLNATFVRVAELLGRISVKVNLEGTPSVTLDGENALRRVGVVITYSYAPMSHAPPCGREVPR